MMFPHCLRGGDVRGANDVFKCLSDWLRHFPISERGGGGREVGVAAALQGETFLNAHHLVQMPNKDTIKLSTLVIKHGDCQ